MWWTALIQIAGSAVADAASRMDKAEAMKLIQSVTDMYGNIDVPQLQKLILEKAPDTKLANIRDDPTYRAQQNSADAQLNNVIDSGGLTLSDRAALNTVRNKVSRTESAGRRAIESSMAARGSLDSGAQLAMQLQGNQQAAQSAAEAGEHTSGVAQARSFEAIRERARNAGSGLDRSYRQESDKARAQDAINQGNANIANTANKYNAGLAQQDFQNKLSLANAKAQPIYAQSGAHAANAKDTQQQVQGVANMAGSAANSYASRPSNSGGGGFANESGGQDWGTDSSGLTNEPTRPQRRVVARRPDGSPVYEDQLR